MLFVKICWYTNYQEVEQLTTDHFTNIYKLDEPNDKEGIVHWLESINLPKLSEIHIDHISKPFTEEVRAVIFHMSPFKAPGSDGLPTADSKS